MSRESIRLAYEARKRKIAQRLDRQEQDEARREGVDMSVIAIVFGAACVGVGVTASGAGAAVGAIILIGAACVGLIYGIDELSISSINDARSRAETEEENEDSSYLETLRMLGE